jgi:hypothetical protein
MRRQSLSPGIGLQLNSGNRKPGPQLNSENRKPGLQLNEVVLELNKVELELLLKAEC